MTEATMTKKQKEFLQQPCETNEHWVGLMVLHHFSKAEIKALRAMLVRLDETLYKSWAKDMTLNQIQEAIALIP